MESDRIVDVLLTDYTTLVGWRQDLVSGFQKLMYFLSTIVAGFAFAFSDQGTFLFPFLPLIILIHVSVMMWWHYNLFSVERYIMALEKQLSVAVHSSAPAYHRMLIGEIFYKNVLGTKSSGRFLKPTLMLTFFYSITVVVIYAISLLKGFSPVRDKYGEFVAWMYVVLFIGLLSFALGNYARFPKIMCKYFEAITSKYLIEKEEVKKKPPVSNC